MTPSRADSMDPVFLKLPGSAASILGSAVTGSRAISVRAPFLFVRLHNKCIRQPRIAAQRLGLLCHLCLHKTGTCI